MVTVIGTFTASPSASVASNGETKRQRIASRCVIERAEQRDRVIRVAWLVERNAEHG